MILASNSPRRKEILERIGFNLEIVTKEVEEKSDKGTPLEIVKEIALKKGRAVAELYPEKYVVSADTMVVLNQRVIGKPKDRNEAKIILKELSEKYHEVITAYAFFNLSKNIVEVRAVISKVFFKKISEEEIEWYLSKGEYIDKAGAYGIQGLGSIFVEKIEGDYFSIMGFPLENFIELLKKKNIMINDIANI